MNIGLKIKDTYVIYASIAIGWVWVLFSYYMDKLDFADSGSILVMFSVLNEFYMRRLKEDQQIEMNRAFVIFNTYSIAFGTLIWGYGNTLLTEAFQSTMWYVIGVSIVFFIFSIKFVLKITD